MSHAIDSRSAGAGAPAPARTFATGIRRTLSGMWRELAGAWRYAAARREFNAVDPNTLRDLGISRGEFESYWAESHGLAEPTRVRVMRHIRGSGL